MTGDELSRLGKISLFTGYNEIQIDKTFEYYDDTAEDSDVVVNGTASTCIKSISYNIDNNIKYEYTYDARGNITKIIVKENETVIEQYDDLNQLIKEDIDTGSFINTYVYEYDDHGNILHKKIYIYKTDIFQFDYGYNYESNGWNDQLTSFNGKQLHMMI